MTTMFAVSDLSCTRPSPAGYYATREVAELAARDLIESGYATSVAVAEYEIRSTPSRAEPDEISYSMWWLDRLSRQPGRHAVKG